MKPHPEIFPWFFGTWVVLGLFGMWLSFGDRNVARKKRLQPLLTIGAGALFVFFVLLITGQPRLLIVLTPVIALITAINLRSIRVCESCGRTVFNNVMFGKMEYCSKCGSKLS